MNQEVITNAQGGSQHKINYAMHRLDPYALLELGKVLALGDSLYNKGGCAIGEENWRLIPQLDHLNHALTHIIQHMHELQYGINRSEPDAGQHLSHAMCRLMFALGSQSSIASDANSKLRNELQIVSSKLQDLRTSVANLAQE